MDVESNNFTFNIGHDQYYSVFFIQMFLEELGIYLTDYS